MYTSGIYELEPFEICGIRPPTENSSLTFRLTRNCPWNRCRFCPVYKTGARFSRRPAEEIKEDVRRARRIDDLLCDEGIGVGLSPDSDYRRAEALINRLRAARGDAGTSASRDIPPDMDPRLAWFYSWFKEKPSLEEGVYHLLNWRLDGGRTCFLGDADSMILKPDFLQGIIATIRLHFPTLSRFTVYGRMKTVARHRTVKELSAYAQAGLDRVHFGMESGSDEVLSLVDKGVTSEQQVEACRKLREGGISPSVYVMPGLGGSALSQKHAEETSAALTRCEPDFIRLRSLEVFPGTPLEELRDSGGFFEASEEEVVREIRTMIAGIGCRSRVYSDSASNLLAVNGRLPEDRQEMLSTIDAYLALSPREKLEFSLGARLSSFLGQYGQLTPDILQRIYPLLSKGVIECSRASDKSLKEIIALIRSKLMP